MNTGPNASASRIVCAAALLTLVLGSAPATAQTTALFLDSQPGDYFGGGETHTYGPADATFDLWPSSPNGFRLLVEGSTFWWLVDLVPPGTAPLAVGTYAPAGRVSFGTVAGLSISGNESWCNRQTGRFVVLEIEYGDDGSIVRFAADMEQHCADAAPALFAAVRYNSTIASLVPFGGNYPRYELSISPPVHGAVTGGDIACGGTRSACSSTFAYASSVVLSAIPDRGYIFTGWTGACIGGPTITVNVNIVKECSATFDTGLATGPRTLLTWDSAPGEYVGQGRKQVYSAANSVWTVAAVGDGNGVQIRIGSLGDDTSESIWNLGFLAPMGALLAPGTYTGVSRAPFRTTTPGLEIWGNGGVCNIVTGSFTVHEFTRTPLGEVAAFAADFEQHCESSSSPALAGSVRFNSIVPQPTPLVSLSTSKLNFRVAVDLETLAHRLLTPPQTVSITQSAPGPITWTATSRDSWIVVTPSSGTGAATFQVAYVESQYPPYVDTAVDVSFAGAANTVAPIVVTVDTLAIHVPEHRAIRGDVDTDGAADLTLFRPGDGTWSTRLHSSEFAFGPDSQPGLGTDKPVPGDYDGDGRIDIAVYRPSNGIWYVIYSSTGEHAALQWGIETDVPMPDDYTGDLRTDLAVWRPSTGEWFIYDLATRTFTSRQWGISTDIPLTGDYDHDGKADVAVYRRSTGVWWVYFSSTRTYAPLQWGIPTDIPVPADYTGDGRTDLAVYRPSNGHWFVYDLSSGRSAVYQWGLSTDIPVPKDYDGDLRTDLAIWRPSTATWFIYFLGTNTYMSVAHGASGDVPIR